MTMAPLADVAITDVAKAIFLRCRSAAAFSARRRLNISDTPFRCIFSSSTNRYVVDAPSTLLSQHEYYSSPALTVRPPQPCMPQQATGHTFITRTWEFGRPNYANFSINSRIASGIGTGCPVGKCTLTVTSRTTECSSPVAA